MLTTQMIFELLVNSPTQAKSLLHNLVPGSGSIALYMNADKTEYMCFNKKRENISTLFAGSLIFVDEFMDRGSSYSFTECDITM